MNDHDPTSPPEISPAHPVSSETSGPSVTGSPGDAGAGRPPSPESARRGVREWLSNRRTRWIVAGALVLPVLGLSAGLATSPSATATSSTATTGQLAPGTAAAGGLGSGGGGSNARSGPASGGAIGTVGSVSKSSFTMTTSAGQKVTVNEASTTKYQKGTSSISASAITKGKRVLVLGTTSGTTIKATQVIVQTTGAGGSTTAAAAKVIPFQHGAPTTSKQVGQIPATFSQGSGTIVSGTTANKATEAALAAYPGGVVNRVVKLSNGEYNVHILGVSWPHHVFVNQSFKIVGAE
jgi:hypothetical protein